MYSQINNKKGLDVWWNHLRSVGKVVSDILQRSCTSITRGVTASFFDSGPVSILRD